MQTLNFEINLPEIENSRNLPIHEEYFLLTHDDSTSPVRLHDYSTIYSIPFLYEHLMERLSCQSHTVLTSLLVQEFTHHDRTVNDMVVLDMGAGSGLVGHTLSTLGVQSLVGIDIEPEAAQAARRQYPGIYENYYVEDLRHLTQQTQRALAQRQFNCMICCSALSNGHVSADALSAVFNQIANNGCVAFNVAQYFWEDDTETGFRQQHPWVDNPDIFEVAQMQPYRHRLYTDGRPLEYLAIIGRKRSGF
ncbi:MAG: class I SAM-dependent methyltransferase [Merismopedia sp. SIO2A8]|nr:class I SAM-dependent methyltransferase [Merismopedia sp. SIO2A8]